MRRPLHRPANWTVRPADPEGKRRRGGHGQGQWRHGSHLQSMRNARLPTRTAASGHWDDTALGSSAGDRWTYDGTTPDGVLVRATRAVQHIFFFFTAATTVTADAIAVAEPFNPVLPLALVSCVPTDEVAQHPGALPPHDDLRHQSLQLRHRSGRQGRLDLPDLQRQRHRGQPVHGARHRSGEVQRGRFRQGA